MKLKEYFDYCLGDKNSYNVYYNVYRINVLTHKIERAIITRVENISLFFTDVELVVKQFLPLTHFIKSKTNTIILISLAN